MRVNYNDLANSTVKQQQGGFLACNILFFFCLVCRSLEKKNKKIKTEIDSEVVYNGYISIPGSTPLGPTMNKAIIIYNSAMYPCKHGMVRLFNHPI